jgi:hypothetical protein
MADQRLTTRSNGFFVGVLKPGSEVACEQAYRDSLRGHFVVSGESRWLTQSIAGFPVFDILILSIRRVETSQPPLPDGVMTHGDGSAPGTSKIAGGD